jgi:predicted RNA-binding protein
MGTISLLNKIVRVLLWIAACIVASYIIIITINNTVDLTLPPEELAHQTAYTPYESQPVKEVPKLGAEFVEAKMVELNSLLDTHMNEQFTIVDNPENGLSEKRIRAYKEELSRIKAYNNEENFINLTILTQSFNMDTCNKYNTTDFCYNLDADDLRKVEMKQNIKAFTAWAISRMNDYEKELYQYTITNKIEKAIRNSSSGILTRDELAKIFKFPEPKPTN